MSDPKKSVQFESLLNHLSLIQKPGYQSVQIEPEVDILNEKGQSSTLSAFDLWYPQNVGNFSVLEERVANRLKEMHHVHTTEVARAVISLAAVFRSSKETTSDFLEMCLQAIRECRLLQFFVLPKVKHQDPIKDFKVGNFELGKINLDQMRHWCSVADSNFFRLYEDSLQGSFGLTAGDRPVHVVPWGSSKVPLNSSYTTEMVDRFLNVYYSAVAKATFEEFWELFKKGQSVSVAMGAPVIDRSVFSFIPGCSMISVFHKIRGEKGWVIPLGTSRKMYLDLNGLDVSYPKVTERVRQEFRFGEFPDTALHELIAITSDFVAKAREFEEKNMLEDAFLHYVIAMDLLLAEEGASGYTFKRRGAVLLSRGHSGKFSDFSAKLKDVYDTRSSYVHQGKMSGDLLEFLQSNAPKVIECLLKMYSNPKWHTDDFRAKWYRELDFIAASIEAGRTPSIKDLEAIGLSDSNGSADGSLKSA